MQTFNYLVWMGGGGYPSISSDYLENPRASYVIRCDTLTPTIGYKVQQTIGLLIARPLLEVLTEFRSFIGPRNSPYSYNHYHESDITAVSTTLSVSIMTECWGWLYPHTSLIANSCARIYLMKANVTGVRSCLRVCYTRGWGKCKWT